MEWRGRLTGSPHGGGRGVDSNVGGGGGGMGKSRDGGAKKTSATRLGGVTGRDKLAALSGEWEVEQCFASDPAQWEHANAYTDADLDDLDALLASAAGLRAQRRRPAQSRRDASRLFSTAGTPQKVTAADVGLGSAERVLDAALDSTAARLGVVGGLDLSFGCGDAGDDGCDNGDISLGDW